MFSNQEESFQYRKNGELQGMVCIHCSALLQRVISNLTTQNPTFQPSYGKFIYLIHAV